MLGIGSNDSYSLCQQLDTASTAKQQFLTIASKRQALESLIKITSGIHNQQTALNDLALAAKPPQIFSEKVVAFFDEIKRRLKDVSVSEIIQKLEAIEAVTQRTFDDIIQLTSLDINQLRDNQIESMDIEGFSDAIDNFKRRTQTALAFRILLQNRGVAIQPFKLPISQEDVAEQIDILKQKEHQCVEQVKQEINSIIEDTNSLLRQSLPEEMLSELRTVKRAMNANLNHLSKGGLITEIPHSFEVISLESEQPDFFTEESETEPSSEIVKSESNEDATSEELSKTPDKCSKEPNTDNNETHLKQSFWQLLKAWLLSPWSTSWRSLKEKNHSNK